MSLDAGCYYGLAFPKLFNSVKQGQRGSGAEEDGGGALPGFMCITSVTHVDFSFRPVRLASSPQPVYR